MWTIFLDMDGVLVDFVGGAHREHGRQNAYVMDPNEHRWNIEEIWGITTKQFWNPLKRKGFWLELDKTPEADQIVELAIRTVGVRNVAICTSPSLDANCVPEKREWVKKYYPQLVNSMIFAHNKYFLAAKERILIDDRDRNINDWEEYGGHGILVPRQWNDEWVYKDHAFEAVEKQLNILKEEHVTLSTQHLAVQPPVLEKNLAQQN